LNRFSAALLPNTHVPQSDRNYLAVLYDERAESQSGRRALGRNNHGGGAVDFS
jgi:hypothetical protein